MMDSQESVFEYIDTHNGSLERTCEGVSYDKTQSLKLSLVAVFSFQISSSYFSHTVSCIKLLITLLCVHTHSSGKAPTAHRLILDCKPDTSICSGVYEQTTSFINFFFFGEANQCQTHRSVLNYCKDFKSKSKKSILLYISNIDSLFALLLTLNSTSMQLANFLYCAICYSADSNRQDNQRPEEHGSLHDGCLCGCLAAPIYLQMPLLQKKFPHCSPFLG